MTQKPDSETPFQASNEKAVIWARQMMIRKRAEQKKMEEDYKTNFKLQAALAKLREEDDRTDNDVARPYKFLSVQRGSNS